MVEKPIFIEHFGKCGLKNQRRLVSHKESKQTLKSLQLDGHQITQQIWIKTLGVIFFAVGYSLVKKYPNY